MAHRAKQGSDPLGYDEWLEALGSARKDDPGYTTNELAERWGVNVDSARIRLRTLHRRELIEAGRKTISSISGATVTVPCYRLKGKGKNQGGRHG